MNVFKSDSYFYLKDFKNLSELPITYIFDFILFENDFQNNSNVQ